MRLRKTIRRNVRCFGWRGAMLALRELPTQAAIPVSVYSPHLRRRLWVRLNTTDISIYQQIFVNREYEMALKREPAVIVDAGANVGFSAIYFSVRYPAARIVALEPEASNFELLKRNVAAFPGIEPVRKAVWSCVADLDLFDAGSGRAGLQKDGFQTFPPGERPSSATVPAVDLDTLMTEMRIDFIDVLKIDVEGAEREIFGKGGAWLNKVGVIVAELHDRMRPGCSRAFYGATSHFETEAYRGENVIVAKADRLMLPSG